MMMPTSPVGAQTSPSAAVEAASPLLNRELSWLEFNRRVLAEARDERNPTLERVRFLAITASNLDEFYTTRIGWLKRIALPNPDTRTPDGMTVAEQLPVIRERAAELRADIGRTWVESLLPALRTHGVKVVAHASLPDESQSRLAMYFLNTIFPVLTPLVVDAAHPFPFISGGSLSLIFSVRDPRSGQVRLARVKVPQNLPRLVDAGGLRFILIEDLIAAHLHTLFPGVEIADVRLLRVLRSTDLEASGEQGEDLLEMIEGGLQRLRFAPAVAIELDGDLPQPRLQLLLQELQLEAADASVVPGPLGLADMMEVANIQMGDLTFPPFVAAVPEAFRRVTGTGSLFAAILRNDLLVHHPYESFDATVVRFVREAAADPAVLAIKQTMYRTSPDSPILESLIEAAARGKQVAVLVELSARADEATNIDWARRLEEAGVHVAYGNPDRKIHSKLCLVVREEVKGVRAFAHIGTGNYNSRTARVYTDLGLFTADREICSDVIRVFNHLTGLSDHLETSRLLVAPLNLRSELEHRVHREIAHAEAGRPAHLIFKMNALEDAGFVGLLYKASRAGVQVDLIVRGICRLRAGVPGLSENIRVVSIIGRFLEHSRIYYFQNDDAPEYFIGSADLMKRNLDDRIEVLTPVLDPALTARLSDILRRCLDERRQAWQLRDSLWERDPDAPALGIHETLLARAPFDMVR
jgi:polyphosphate kinase